MPCCIKNASISSQVRTQREHHGRARRSTVNKFSRGSEISESSFSKTIEIDVIAISKNRENSRIDRVIAIELS
jgi:hypothetical protein